MNEYLVHYMDKDEKKVRVFYFLDYKNLTGKSSTWRKSSSTSMPTPRLFQPDSRGRCTAPAQRVHGLPDRRQHAQPAAVIKRS